MRDLRTDIRADQLRRQQLRRPPLQALTFERIDGVRRPHAVGVFEYLQIDAGTARCTGLELDLWMSGSQGIKQPIERGGLLMHRTASVGVDGEYQVPVVIPLHVVRPLVGQHRIDGPEEKVEYVVTARSSTC